jgi:hypothetical protein
MARKQSFLVCPNLVPRACDPWEGTRGSGIIRCRKPGIMAKIELRIHFNGQSDSSLKRIIPEPHVPSRGSQARGTRLGLPISRNMARKQCFQVFPPLGNMARRQYVSWFAHLQETWLGPQFKLLDKHFRYITILISKFFSEYCDPVEHHSTSPQAPKHRSGHCHVHLWRTIRYSLSSQFQRHDQRPCDKPKEAHLILRSKRSCIHFAWVGKT